MTVDEIIHTANGWKAIHRRTHRGSVFLVETPAGEEAKLCKNSDEAIAWLKDKFPASRDSLSDAWAKARSAIKKALE